MSEGGDDFERKIKRTDESTGDGASPRDKKTRLLTTDGETPVPVSRARPISAQELLVAGIMHGCHKTLHRPHRPHPVAYLGFGKGGPWRAHEAQAHNGV